MKYLKLFEDIVSFDEDDWDFDEEEFVSDEEYFVYNNGNYTLIGLRKVGANNGKLMQNISNGKLQGFLWGHEFTEKYTLDENDIKNINNGLKILTAAGYTDHKYTLDEFKEFMNEDIPIKFYK